MTRVVHTTTECFSRYIILGKTAHNSRYILTVLIQADLTHSMHCLVFICVGRCGRMSAKKVQSCLNYPHAMSRPPDAAGTSLRRFRTLGHGEGDESRNRLSAERPNENNKRRACCPCGMYIVHCTRTRTPMYIHTSTRTPQFSGSEIYISCRIVLEHIDCKLH